MEILPLWDSYEYYNFPQNIDYSSYLIINPEIRNIADITIEAQDLIVIMRPIGVTSTDRIWINPKSLINGLGGVGGGAWPTDYGVRFAIRVTPKDGSPSSLILKTLALKPNITYREEYI